MPEPIFMKLSMYIMTPAPISTTYFISPYCHSVCLYVYPPMVATQRHGKNVTTATNTRSNRRHVGRVVLYAVRVVKRKVATNSSQNFSFLTYFSYFEKQSRLMRSRWRLCMWVFVYPPPINFWTPEQIFMKLGSYITAAEPIW
jgi:hypothetical protein